MYNDERNLYHYTYRKDGSETFHQSSAPISQQPVEDLKPVKKRVWPKVLAMLLACALVGAAAGGGAAWGVSSRMLRERPAQSEALPAGQTDKDNQNQEETRRPTAVSAGTGEGLSDAEIYRNNVNSVVSINVTGTSGTNIFRQPVPYASSGSGFVITKDGYIATNYHVIEDGDKVTVSLYDGTTYDAEIIGGDETYDIAVIKVDANNLKPVTLGDSSALQVGDHVLAIGNPLGELTFSLSGGMVSSVNRSINVSGVPFNMIQTDASINHGNSGGPLLDEKGEVVGIVSAKYGNSSSSDSVEGLGFAIPINDVAAMIQDIMTNGYVTNKPYLGITPQTLTAQTAAQFRFEITSGVFVCSTEPGSAAEKAGLKMGDVITKVDDTEVKTVAELNAAKKKYAAGDSATLTVYRSGETLELPVVWDATPEDQLASQEQQQEESRDDNTYGGNYNPFDMFDYFFNGGW